MRPRVAGALLVCLGLSQMAGDLLGLPALKALAAASAASPAPRVFCASRGREPFSTRFLLEWHEVDGTVRSVPVTPELGGRMRGPYNRRNVHGAALAAGPVLVEDPRLRPMFDGVTTHAFCGERPLLSELGFDASRVVSDIRIRYEPRPGTGEAALIRVVCP